MSFPALRALAPSKINLGLFVGPVRGDGRHELVSVMQSVTLADEVTLEPAGGREEGGRREGGRRVLGGSEGARACVDDDGGAVPAGSEDPRAHVDGGGPGTRAGDDELVCPGVEGPDEQNLAMRALAAFRKATGWDEGAIRIEIVKRVPVAAGMGGGSADAAAALRLAAAASGLGEESLLLRLAAELGADTPAQVSPGRSLARGAGERLQPLPAPTNPFGVLVLASQMSLATADVYAQCDRLGGLRTEAELEQIAEGLLGALRRGEPLPSEELLCNDLQPAAVALCPEIAQALDTARWSGADVAMVSGSGPTVLGLFAGEDGPVRARRAAESLEGELGGALRAALSCTPVGEGFGAPVRNNASRSL